MTRSLFELARKLKPENVSREFRDFRQPRAYAAARSLMDEVFADFPDVDRSFAREFQTGGFSARVLELALFAALQEQGHSLDRSNAAPDFLLRGDNPVAIEATTSNPAQDLAPADSNATATAYQYVPADLEAAEAQFTFQVGKALRAKLNKRDAQHRAYWEMPHVEGVPFVVALQVFHNPSALFHAVGPLTTYLYGHRDVPTHDAAGTLLLQSEPVPQHEYQGKTIPGGLFAQPGSEHLAAVIFTNSATISKFGRMGTERGYGPDDVAMARFGSMYNPDPNAHLPMPFAYVVGDYGPEDHETFSEGFHVLHNPWALTPIAEGVLSGFTEHRLQEDGRLLSTFRVPEIFASRTRIIEGAKALSAARAEVARYVACAAAGSEQAAST